MKINLNMLPVVIDQFFEIPKDIYNDTEILELEPVNVSGNINYNALDDVFIDLKVQGVMVLNDAISNLPVKYPYSFQINENLSDLDGENEKYFEKNQNLLDIIEFLWENIVLEVPISYTVNESVHQKGEGWELNKKIVDEEINPQMQKLSELFKGGE